MTMFSRVLGFARDAIVAESLAQGWQPTPFSSLLNFLTVTPYLCRRGIFPGICTDSGEYKSKQGEDATRVFVSYVSGC